MGIEVEGPDGKVHAFPDGTSNEQINAQMSRQYGDGGALQPYNQKAGDATAASGAVTPSMQSVPDYMTDEDMDQLMLTRMFPHAASVISNTPGHKARVSQAEVVGKNLGNLEERQRGGQQVMGILQKLKTTADKGHEDGILESAIGPVDSSPMFQKVRGAIPGIGNYYEKSYNLNNQLNHIIHGLTTAFVSSASKGGIQMSDARQKAFEETMGAMMHATNKEDFDRIYHDAEQIIAGTFGLTPGASAEPTRSSRVAQPVGPTGNAQRYHNPKTGEVIQWDGKQWQKVN